MSENDWNFASKEPRWVCQECGFTSKSVPNENHKGKCRKCPKCKSDALTPVGL